jgi:hypothetical protein
MAKPIFFLVLISMGMYNPFCTAQTGSISRTEHVRYPIAFTPYFRADLLFDSASYLYFENSERFGGRPPDGTLFSIPPLHEMQNQLGYEHAMNARWFIGLSAKFVNEPARYYLLPRTNISYRRQVKKFLINQELSLEIFKFTSNTIGENLTRCAYSFSAGKKWDFGKNNIYIYFTGRFFFYFDLQNKNSYYYNRFIDKSIFRMDVFYYIRNKVGFGLFISRETDYLYAHGGFASDDYKINYLSSGFGIQINWLIRGERSTYFQPFLPFR